MTTEIYQLKITAKDIQPRIERVIWIKSTATFLKLHRTLQTLFGLADYHLFEFYVNRDAAPISDGYDNARLAKNVKLSSEFKYTKKMHYTYDFGDDWSFSITLQKKLPYSDAFAYPFCIDSIGGMLIEDCGGAYCYNLIAAWCREKTENNKNSLLEIIDKEAIEQYENFSPDAFDRNEINRILGKK